MAEFISNISYLWGFGCLVVAMLVLCIGATAIRSPHRYITRGAVTLVACLMVVDVTDMLKAHGTEIAACEAESEGLRDTIGRGIRLPALRDGYVPIFVREDMLPLIRPGGMHALEMANGEPLWLTDDVIATGLRHMKDKDSADN